MYGHMYVCKTPNKRCMYVFVCLHTHTHAPLNKNFSYAWIFANVCLHVNTHTHTHICMYVCMYVYTHTYTYISIFAHRQTSKQKFRCIQTQVCFHKTCSWNMVIGIRLTCVCVRIAGESSLLPGPNSFPQAGSASID